MRKFTKIVATVSDQRCDLDFIQKIVNEGVNVVRLNSAHMNHEGFDRVIDNVRQVSPYIATLMDTKGPEIRTTTNDAPIPLTAGMRMRLIADPEVKTTPEQISVNYTGFLHDVPVGAHVLIDDGEIELDVVENNGDHFVCAVLNDGVLGARKSVNVPGVQIKLPSLTPRDKETIMYSIKKDVEFIAHSFVRSKQDVLDIQKILDEHDSKIKIISKIENAEGVDNIDEIIDVSYGIMVARGDLGIEIAQEKIPAIQAMIINKCVLKKKPVIVATQMLHTMITSPRPTRAEVSDVATAILLRSDAVMLSGETAYGKYPVEAVRTMRNIISEAELNRPSLSTTSFKGSKEEVDVTSYLSRNAVRSVNKLGVRAIITDSYSGRTARNLSAYRGTVPVYAICYNSRVTRELALSYGIWTLFQERNHDRVEYYCRALRHLVRSQYLTGHDMVAYIGGNLGHDIGTTTLEIHRIQEVLDYYVEHGVIPKDPQETGEVLPIEDAPRRDLNAKKK